MGLKLKNVLPMFVFLLLASTAKAQSAALDVTSAKYGGKPDSDITQALEKAWTDACASTAPSKIVVPRGRFKFVGTTFKGPCKAAIEFQQQGTLQAPVDGSQLPKDNTWIGFDHVTGSPCQLMAKEHSLGKTMIATKIDNANLNTLIGDDCISIGDGTKDITVTNVTCGLGHGIATRSLGRYPEEAPVSGINIKNCTLIDTTNGVRIKTWPASPKDGTASDIHFEDITIVNVGNPILINQEYCPWNECKKGLVCSQGLPCENVELSDIDLKYTGNKGPITSVCSNVKPTINRVAQPLACATGAAAA
ncbi:hypothetical protein ACE6H2_011625 [Prunus campanulata]